MEPARDKIHLCRQALGRANFQVGYFYQKTRQAWRAAIARYEVILSEYPDFDRVDEVLYRLAECLGNAGRYAEARPHLGRLQAEFPESPFRESAKKLEATFPPPGVPATPPPAGSPSQKKPDDPPKTGSPPGSR